MNKSTLLALIFLLKLTESYSQTHSKFSHDAKQRLTKVSYSPQCLFISYDYDQDDNIILETQKSFLINSLVENLLCPTDSFGSITLTPITTGLTFLWSNGVTGTVLDSLPAGHYDVAITETATGNTCSQGFEITNVSSAGVASVSTQPVSCNNENDGSAFVAIQGGWGQYTYSWSNGDTTDKASPKLFEAVASGKHIPKATLTVRKAGSDVVVWNLEDIMVTSYKATASTTDTPTDQFSLNFTKIQVEYKGSSSGSSDASKAGWDVKANKKI